MKDALSIVASFKKRQKRMRAVYREGVFTFNQPIAGRHKDEN